MKNRAPAASLMGFYGAGGPFICPAGQSKRSDPHRTFGPKSAGPPMTLGKAAAAKVRFVVWCKACSHRSEPDPAEQARSYGPETTVPAWDKRLVCSKWKN